MTLTQLGTEGIKDDAVTLAKQAAGTDGQVITYDASGNPVAVGPGTDGQVLTSTGAGSPPAFETLPASNNYTHPNHSGEVTSTADGAQVIADDVVDEANLKISNAGSDGQFLSKQSGNTGGLTWATVSSTPEGTAILSTGESGGSKFLREDGDGSCSWQTVAGGVSSDADTNTVAGTNAGNAGTWSGANGNTCIGYNSGTDLSSADYNTLVGEESGANLTTGYKNVAIGNKALETSTNGFENTVVGWSALPIVPYGTQNVAIGCKALESGDDAGIRENVAVGFEALKDLTGTYTQAYGNVALGYMAGRDNDDKPECCFLGRQAGMNQTMLFGELWIAHRDHAKGTDSVWIHGASDGKCINGDNSSSWNTTSDERIKKNIVDNNVGLEKIKQLKVRNFEYKLQEETGKDEEGHTTWAPKTDSDVIDTSTFTTLPNGQKPRPDQVAINKTGVKIGCIAQEVEAVLPNSVATDGNGCKSVQTDEMFWLMVNAVKQLSDKNDALEARIAALEAA